MRRDDGVKINGCGCGEGDALPLVSKTRCTGVEEGSSLFWVEIEANGYRGGVPPTVWVSWEGGGVVAPPGVEIEEEEGLYLLSASNSGWRGVEEWVAPPPGVEIRGDRGGSKSRGIGVEDGSCLTLPFSGVKIGVNRGGGGPLLHASKSRGLGVL